VAFWLRSNLSAAERVWVISQYSTPYGIYIYDNIRVCAWVQYVCVCVSERRLHLSWTCWLDLLYKHIFRQLLDLICFTSLCLSVSLFLCLFVYALFLSLSLSLCRVCSVCNYWTATTSFMNVSTWFAATWLNHVCAWCGLCPVIYVCVIWRIIVCDITPWRVWHDSLISHFIMCTMACHSCVCDMTHAHVWHGSFICVT